MPSRSGGYAQKTTLVGTRVSDDEDIIFIFGQVQLPLWASFTIHN